MQSTMDEKIKRLISDFMAQNKAKEIEETLWGLYISAIFSEDFQCWGPSRQIYAAELYRDISRLFISLEVLMSKNN